MNEPQDVEPTPGTVYTFPPSRLPDAVRSIEKANRKLARFKVPGQFSYTVGEPREVGDTTEGGVHVSRLVVDLTLDTPTLCFAGWEFVATLVHEQAGVITRTVPGKSLDGWQPSRDKICDHCHTNRYRRDTYVVRHVGTGDEPGTGEVKQVGSNCIAAFLGVRPAGLWLLDYNPIDEGELNEDENHAGRGRGDFRVPVREIIRYSLASSDMGRSFRSRASVQYDASGIATVDVARHLMFDRFTEKDRKEFAKEIAAVPDVTEEQIDAVLEAGRSIEGEGEYPANLRVAIASEAVDVRTMGLVASAIAIWNRNEQRRAESETKAQIAKGFLAQPKEKITDIPVVITGVRYTADYTGRGTTTILTLLATDTGHQLKWFATGEKDYDIGQAATLLRATIKKHATWQGVDETVITRAKLDIPEPGDSGSGPDV